MTDSIEHSESADLSRRSLLRRSALVGGAMLWTVPTVQTIASFDLAAAASPGGNGGGSICGDISWVAVVVKCGGAYYAYKMSGDTLVNNQIYAPEFKPSDDTGQGADAWTHMLQNAAGGPIALSTTAPATVPITASGSADGSLIVNVAAGSTCQIVSFMIHDGQVDGNGTLHDNSRAYGDTYNSPAGWVYPANGSLPASSADFVKPGTNHLVCQTPPATA